MPAQENAKLAKCSRDAALRDTGFFAERGLLVRNTGGRSKGQLYPRPPPDVRVWNGSQKRRRTKPGHWITPPSPIPDNVLHCENSRARAQRLHKRWMLGVKITCAVDN
jgi:hypothetical protein